MNRKKNQQYTRHMQARIETNRQIYMNTQRDREAYRPADSVERVVVIGREERVISEAIEQVEQVELKTWHQFWTVARVHVTTSRYHRQQTHQRHHCITHTRHQRTCAIARSRNKRPMTNFFFFFSNNAQSSELSNVVHGGCVWSALEATDKSIFHRQITTCWSVR